MRSRSLGRGFRDATEGTGFALYVLVHRDADPIFTGLTLEEVARELVAVLNDEPDWRGDLWLERSELRITAPAAWSRAR